MAKAWLAGLLGVAVLSVGIAQAQPGERLRERIAKRMEQRAAGDGQRQRAPGAQTLSYGSDPAQVLDLWVRKGAKAAPLVLYVHGGGWKRGSKDTAMGNALPGHLVGQGYAFASINYRLVPAATVEQQASDVAQALAFVLARADKLGIDRSKVVITGHSAGAHLVALVGTDEQYLRKAGLSFADLDGVMPNDGAAYDVPKQMEQAGRMMADTYKQAFGTDPARQNALSPVFHAAAPNAPRFLLLHVQREDGVAQAQELGAALKKAGVSVEFGSFPGKGLQGHAEINRKLGEPDYPATPVMDAWLKGVFGGVGQLGPLPFRGEGWERGRAQDHSQLRLGDSTIRAAEAAGSAVLHGACPCIRLKVVVRPDNECRAAFRPGTNRSV